MARIRTLRPKHPAFSRGFRVLLGILSLCLTGILEPERSNANEFEDTGYIIRRWDLDSGLPRNHVARLVQSNDGFLWAGFSNGLARFDGHEFKVFRKGGPEGLSFQQVSDIFEDASGRLILQHARNQPLSVYENRRFRRLGPGTVITSPRIQLRMSTHGVLWKFDPLANSVSQLVDDEFVPIFVNTPGLEDPSMELLGVAGAHPWFTERMRVLYRLTPEGELERVDYATEHTYIYEFRSPVEKPSLRFLTDNKLYRIEGPRVILEPSGLQVANFGGYSRPRVIMDRNENLWNMEAPQFHLRRTGRDGTVTRDRLGFARDYALLPGIEGDIWMSGNGLFQLVPTPFQKIPALSALPREPGGWLVPDSKGGIWTRALGELRHISKSGTSLRTFPSLQNFDKCALSNDGTLWLAKWAQRIARMDTETGQILQELTLPTSAKIGILALVEDHKGTLWVTTNGRGVWYLDSGRMTQSNLPQKLAKSSCFRAISLLDGALAFAHRNEAFLYDEGELRIETIPSPSRNFAPMGLEQTANGHLWWLGNRQESESPQEGLLGIRANGEWSVLSAESTGLNCAAFGLEVDASDGLWVSTPERGVFRFSQSNLLEYVQGTADRITSQRFTKSDGLPTAACASWLSSGITTDSQNNLWVSTSQGIAKLNPSRLQSLQSLRSKPNPRIGGVRIDDIAHPIEVGRQAPSISAGPNARRIEIAYTGIHLSAPSDVRFRFRLRGYDREWVDADARRVAYYQNLRPGDYRFDVMAKLEDDDWGPDSASLNIHVLPAWWQTPAFRASGAGALLGILSLLYSARVRRFRKERLRQREFSRQLLETQEKERKRMAADLHDSLGQNLLVAQNEALMGINEHSDSSDVNSRFQEISRAVSSALAEARSLSRTLRPPELDRMGLTKAIDVMSRRISETFNIPIDAQLDEIDGLLRPEDEINLYRILQEALNNAMKHANASRVDILINHHPSWIRIEVTDNGNGFSLQEAQQAERGFGLSGMEERARMMGGEFIMETDTGGGARLTVTIPAPTPKA